MDTLSAEPVIVTTANRLRSFVAEGVEAGVVKVLASIKDGTEDRPPFGWVTNDRAMDLLGLSRPTLARYRAEGLLPYAKLGGGSIYYRLSDLEGILASRVVRDAA